MLGEPLAITESIYPLALFGSNPNPRFCFFGAGIPTTNQVHERPSTLQSNICRGLEEGFCKDPQLFQQVRACYGFGSTYVAPVF